MKDKAGRVPERGILREEGGEGGKESAKEQKGKIGRVKNKDGRMPKGGISKGQNVEDRHCGGQGGIWPKLEFQNVRGREE